ncbi:hypothetical protein GCM10010191_58730 [Actinomadura vinacea]|uniref:DUF2530 domain-containing protein n=1 Tax=Actinomadura vinacea TaxID=115336 RepID=A0ABN3JQA9_9ACTN
MTRSRRPDPPPMRTNDVRVALAGTAAWTVALITLLIIGVPADARWWLWVCGAGIVIGLFGAWYTPRLQSTRARQAADRSARRAER